MRPTVRNFMILGMALAVMAAPTLMQASEMDNARMAAERDAKSDVNAMLWLGAGCLFGPIGIGAAYVIVPSPPASRLLGKSNEYVAGYTDMYEDAARSIQVNKAMIGCGLWAAWVLLINVVPWLIWGSLWWAYD